MVTFGKLIDHRTLPKQNLEHAQAFAHEVSQTLSQILDRPDVPLEIYVSAPILSKPHRAKWADVMAFWNRLNVWMDALPESVQAIILNSTVAAV